MAQVHGKSEVRYIDDVHITSHYKGQEISVQQRKKNPITIPQSFLVADRETVDDQAQQL